MSQRIPLATGHSTLLYGVRGGDEAKVWHKISDHC